MKERRPLQKAIAVSQSVCLLASVGFLWDSFHFLTQLLISPTDHTASQINNIVPTCWEVFRKLLSNSVARWHSNTLTETGLLKNKKMLKISLKWSLRFNSVSEYIFKGTYHPAGHLPKSVCPQKRVQSHIPILFHCLKEYTENHLY